MASEDNVKALTEITGLEEGPATNLLTAYNGNLEGAINAFFENPEGILNPEPPVVIDEDGDAEQTSSAARSDTIDDDDNVRAPIPRKTEILLPDIEINRARIGKRRGAVITEVPFRNFELEGRIQEQILMQQGHGPSAKKITRLEALFMPPFDILFSGGFDLAQRHGRYVDRWLLVNLQDDLNFSCQTLNRDLWSDAKLKAFVQRHMVFWQQSNKTTDGAKFKTFYKVHSEPYIGMIDPRTGEEVRNFSSADLTSPSQFLDTLKAFLIEKKSPHGKVVNMTQKYIVGIDPSSSSSNGSKLFSTAATSTSTSAGGSGESSTSGTSKQPSEATTSGTNRNNWVTVIDDDEDDFQEITDSESESEDSSRPAAVVPSGESTKSCTAGEAGPSSSQVKISEQEEESDTNEDIFIPSKEDINETDSVPIKVIEVECDRRVLSSDSESDLAPDQKTRIMLKMPGNVTERLFFRSSRKLKRAMDKLRQKYEKHFPSCRYSMDVRFFCQAIKADLSSLDPSKTLLELKIHPNAVIHVTTDD